MNREIKFRGKRVDNGKWVYGHYFMGVPSPLDENKQRHYIAPPCGLGEEVDPATVGQFTGQKDKHGKEVYEGDILRYSRRLFIVTWSNDIGGWVNKPVDGKPSYPCFNTGTVKGMEIVGNIHDNSEVGK